MDTPRFDFDDLVAAAVSAAGTTDLGEDSWQEGLRYLLACLLYTSPSPRD